MRGLRTIFLFINHHHHQSIKLGHGSHKSAQWDRIKSCAEDHVVTRWELHSPFMPSLYFSCLQLFSALTLDKMRSEMRALRHLECERGPWLRSHQHMIDRSHQQMMRCMWLSNLHRHPNHMWSYWDRTSRWLIAPAVDACDWVAFIVIRTICYLI